MNVQANWTQTTATADDYIKNKPTVDNSPTSGSNNLVKSGGVYSGLTARYKKYTLPSNTYHHITITVPSEGNIVQLFGGAFDLKLDYNGSTIRILQAVRRRAFNSVVTYTISGSTIDIDMGENYFRGFILSDKDDITFSGSTTSTGGSNTLEMIDVWDVASTTKNGLMSATDKTKLDGLPYMSITYFFRNMTVTFRGNGVFKLMTTYGEITFNRSGNDVTIFNAFMNVAESTQWTYSFDSTNSILTINCNNSAKGFWLSTVGVVVETNNTSTPQANAITVFNGHT